MLGGGATTCTLAWGGLHDRLAVRADTEVSVLRGGWRGRAGCTRFAVWRPGDAVQLHAVARDSQQAAYWIARIEAHVRRQQQQGRAGQPRLAQVPVAVAVTVPDGGAGGVPIAAALPDLAQGHAGEEAAVQFGALESELAVRYNPETGQQVRIPANLGRFAAVF